MLAPEGLARKKIDELLLGVGWTLQYRDALDRTASLPVALRQFPLASGFADYLLFVDAKAASVIEAKRAEGALHRNV